MPRDLILGTAGHIDHGKTALVKALTGTDCDRLPEEKARGITVDIGFARLDLGDCTVGVVDVPGHERFVRNMLAGATGIDLALLVVAADDSVMPQTREHFDILRLLGVRRGVVALTKIDAADDTTRKVAELEIAEMVKGSFLETAPVVHTSAVTRRGIDELKAAIRTACAAVADRPAGEPFRLPIDRAFVVQGYGTVVTGSVVSGAARAGDEVDWHRGDGTTELVRVRGLNHHGRAVGEVGRGQRAALNLAGVPHDAVRRGQELAAPGALVPSRVLTVRLHALAASPRPIKHRQPVRVHVGTAEVMATVAVLDGTHVPPGGWGFAQLFLDAPVAAVWGQPVVVRDSSAEHTLGGGPVLQPVAAPVRRRHTDRLEHVERLAADDPAVRVAAAAWLAGPGGVTAGELWRTAGVAPAAAAGLLADLVAAGTLIELAVAPGRSLLLHADRVTDLETHLLAALAALHAENPLATAHERQKAFARLAYAGDEPLLQAITDRLLARNALVVDGRRVARADFRPKLNAAQRKAKDRIVEAVRAAGFQPPAPAGFAALVGGKDAVLRDVFAVACAEGLLVRVSADVYLHADSEGELRRRVADRLAGGAAATVTEIKDALGTTRKYAVPFCEYLDRTGLTRRAGDHRVLAAPPPP